MAWLVTDDGLTSDPRILEAIALGGAEVAWLYQCLNVHAARHLTNGFIPATAITLIPTPGVTQVTAGVAMLMRVGLLRAVTNGWRITDYLERNKTAKKIKEKRALDRKRQQEHRDRKRHAVTDGVSDSVTNGAPILSSPILPYKNPRKRETAPSPSASESRFENPDFEVFWQAYPRKAEKGEAFKAWQQLAPNDVLVAKIMKAIKLQKCSLQWRESVIPNPATWLNKQRWDDELPMSKTERPPTTGGPAGFFDPN